MSDVVFESPLQWLSSQPRCKKPERARFGKHSCSKAGDYLLTELNKLGAKNCVISSNLQQRTRGDGFYANQKVDDAGVVVYFGLKGKSKAMACDKWDKVEHNLWALYLSVSSIRGLERWGGSKLLDGLFTGFEALPDYSQGINYFTGLSKEEARIKYLKLAKELHPDAGGNNYEFAEMQKQYKAFGVLEEK